MSVRVSKCPSCGRIQHDGLCILSQRLVAVDELYCEIIENRWCGLCNHRYSVEMYYRLEAERVIKNDHKEVKE